MGENMEDVPPLVVTPLLQGMTLLVVEDDLDSLDMLEAFLRYFGASVLRASTGFEGLARLRERVPDVIISDLNMPGMNGLEMMCEIRCLPAERGGLVPAIALTASTDDATKQITLESGFQLHMGKPISPDKLAHEAARLVT
jgi:CheY-like chemotaxis protein